MQLLLDLGPAPNGDDRRMLEEDHRLGNRALRDRAREGALQLERLAVGHEAETDTGMRRGRSRLLEHPAMTLEVLRGVEAPVRPFLGRADDVRSGRDGRDVVSIEIVDDNEQAVDDPGIVEPACGRLAAFRWVFGL